MSLLYKSYSDENDCAFPSRWWAIDDDGVGKYLAQAMRDPDGLELRFGKKGLCPR